MAPGLPHFREQNPPQETKVLMISEVSFKDHGDVPRFSSKECVDYFSLLVKLVNWLVLLDLMRNVGDIESYR